ncbi:RNA-directed DNA polymerase, eukaryota, Reverse transcriptase zinc-binding domain protein [Artemisia annua]|uniref:RNA-directed DNA polymerase, eukaryota, Reverse transcriptase zinc-binding domain protein n=1 Tax=Artemisia annua TaxID=35608 RepID=A0A2U1M481_ARTAN|nr:RNA-directed DNA polymerase, eukaryota, Reverse transcriptase zinc-binding domain protein [Artemisia annua]
MRSNKASWVKWSSLLTVKEKGGLGVSSMFALNSGLMLKWVWRFYSQKTSLWVRIIKAIHGDDGKVGKDIYSGIRSCWLNIVREVKELQIQRINVLDYIHLKLGNGESILFWEEKWSNDSVLKDLFPRLYALESNKLVTVGAN